MCATDTLGNCDVAAGRFTPLVLRPSGCLVSFCSTGEAPGEKLGTTRSPRLAQ